MKNLPFLSLVINFPNKAPLKHTWSSWGFPRARTREAAVPSPSSGSRAPRWHTRTENKEHRPNPTAVAPAGLCARRSPPAPAGTTRQQSPGLLPGRGMKPSAGRSRARCRLRHPGPERSRLAHVKLKATTETEVSVSTPRAHAPGRIHFTASQFQRIPMKIYPKETDGQGSAFPVTARKQ